MSNSQVSGSMLPGSMSVFYRFPSTDLFKALQHFFGEQESQTIEGHSFLSQLSLPEEYEYPKSHDSFEQLQLLMTFLHEQFHIRHFSSTSFGFLFWLLQAKESVYTMRSIENWARHYEGRQISLRLPMSEHHKSEKEIEWLNALRLRYSVLYRTLMYQEKITLKDTIESVLPFLFQEIESFFKSALGHNFSFPEVYSSQNTGALITDPGVRILSIVEGFARCHEYMTLIKLKVPLEVFNQFILFKATGEYQTVIRYVEKAFNIIPPVSHRVTAYIIEWSLQSPIFPFLLKDTDRVELEELLPNFRLVKIVKAIKEIGFENEQVDIALTQMNTRLENLVFNRLKWISPSDIAQMINGLDLPEKLNAQTRQRLHFQTLSAKSRMSDPACLSNAELAPHLTQLGAGFSIFEDYIILPTGKFTDTPGHESIMETLLEDIISDDLWAHNNLERSKWFAQALSIYRQAPGKGSEIMEKKLTQIFHNPNFKINIPEQKLS